MRLALYLRYAQDSVNALGFEFNLLAYYCNYRLNKRNRQGINSCIRDAIKGIRNEQI